MPDPLALAVTDNALWCDLVCRTHGVPGRFGPGLWSSPVRTPDLYPDAVPLDPGVPAATVLAGVDAGPGCGVKDSFSALDLSEQGFEVLLEGSWIARQGLPPASAPPWEAVRTVEAFEAWRAAWAGDPPAPPVLLPALVHRPEVTLVAVPGDGPGGLDGGAVLHASAGSVGVSNLFGPGGTVWPAVLVAAAAVAPGRPVVGWATDDDLEPARRVGCERVGPLRVWHRP